MPEEDATPAEPPKKRKKALPEAPPEAPAKPKLPTPQEIRAARKADLVAWCESFGLSTEGRVDDLRTRLSGYVAAETKAAPAPTPEAKAEAPKPKEAPAEGKKPAAAKPVKKAPKEEPKKPAKKPRKGAGKEEEGETKEEGAETEYEPNLKPKLEPRIKRLLALRASRSMHRPAFHRQEWFRYKKFGDEWRKPQGGQSKLRRHFGYRWNLPSVGYRGPRDVRGLHPSGFQEVLVHNERQLDGLDPAKQAVRIAHGVGSRKRELIEKSCDDKGLRVLNRMVTE
ncbi:MAG TPA: 50S ribosomal protein L32e [Thermoplasmata archaeon]|nr:50S ribosomal protein L32e [Thermoplasmata archaeon]